MATENLCPLCDTPTSAREITGDKRTILCVRCGRYQISGTAEQIIPNTPEIKEKRYLLSGMTRTHFEFTGGPFYINTDSIGLMIDSAPKNPLEIKYVLLRYLSKNSEYRGEKITFEMKYDYPITFSKNWEEFFFFINHLNETGIVDIIQPTPGFITVTLTFKGWEEVDRLKTTPIDSNQVFLAMKFPKEDPTSKIDLQLLEAYEKGFIPGIEDTGHDCLRIDKKQHNKKVCEEILYEIKQSKFLVADMTGHRGGVYFEAGYALALGKEVVWTCHESDTDNIHFDTQQYNRISWKDAEDLCEQLKNRIFGSIGRGKNEVKPD